MPRTRPGGNKVELGSALQYPPQEYYRERDVGGDLGGQGADGSETGME